jgi:DNA-binding protein HU-beta
MGLANTDKHCYYKHRCSSNQHLKKCKGDFTMNKKELIVAAAAASGLSQKDVEKALKALNEVVVAEVAKKGKVQLIGFGTFEARERAARTGKNPQTGAAIKIAAATVPAFKAGKAFKEAVNAKPAKKAKAKKAKK